MSTHRPSQRGPATPGRRGHARGFWAAIVAAAALSCAAPCDSRDARADARAGAVMNLIRFVQWPAGSLGARDAPLVVAVLGADPTAEGLRAGLDGQRVLGHPLQVRRPASFDDAAGASVLYVGASVATPAGALAGLARSGVLSLGETDAFLDDGGCARIGEVDREIRIEIDADVLATAPFRISSHLLRIVQVRREASAVAARGGR